MSEVSCRAFSYFTAAANAGLVPIDALLAGQVLTRDELEDPNNRVSWDHWVTLCDRFAALVGNEDTLRATGVYVLSEGFRGHLGTLIGLFSESRQIYEVGARWAGPSLYRSITFSVDASDREHITFAAELLPGFRPCRSWFVMIEGALVHIPGFAGLPDALVERVSLTERGGSWRIQPPASGSLASSLRRFMSAVRAPSAIFHELFAQQVQLNRAFDDMRRSATAFRNALDALPLLVAVHEQGQLRYANVAFARLFGRPRAELEGQRLQDLFPSSEQAQLGSLLGDQSASVSLVVPAEGGLRQLEAYGANTVEFGGRPATLFFARDVTVEREAEQRAARSEATQKEVERRLEIAERMASLGSLAAGVAHEINNPLTWVLGNLATLQQQLTGDLSKEEALALLAEVNDGCLRIRDTVGRMREFSRVQKSSHRRLDLTEVVERAARMTNNATRHRAQVELELTPGLEVLGEPTELGQVVVNLLVNAAQAMPPSDRAGDHCIRVRTFEAGGQVVIEVSDDGLGIAPEVLPRIFDPFFTTKQHAAGTGLGLAISQRVVLAHGGTIEVESAPGKTTFSVRLPLPPRRADEGIAPIAVAVAPSRRAKVLVIDDELLVGRSIKRTLRAHDVEVVESADLGLDRLAEGTLPDLVLCDLMMPGRTGMDLYRALARSRPEVLPRLAFISGGIFTPGAAQFLDEHVVVVLTKPFEPADLHTLVARVLATGATAASGER